MFHLFIKVINIEIGTKRFTQPETKNSFFFPPSIPLGVQGVSSRLETAPAVFSFYFIFWCARGDDLSKAFLCIC